MYKVIVSCGGISPKVGPRAAVEITREFVKHRPWHDNVSCVWDGSRLVLSAENDHDPDGLALLDEFSDCICAYTPDGTYEDMKVESASKHDA